MDLILYRVNDDFDWSSLRFDGEAELRGEVERSDRFDEWVTASRRGRCSRPGVRMTRSISPAMYRLGETLQHLFRMRSRVELEQLASTIPFAESVEAHGGESVTIRLGSALTSDCSLAEALFTVGREVGRAMLKQVSFGTDPVAGRAASDRDTLLFRGLYRFQEMACDRAGLLACQDVDLAVRSIVRSASGLPGALVSVALDELLCELVDEEEAMISPGEHEFVLLRVGALRRFWDSARYRRSLSSEPIESSGSLATTSPATISLVRESTLEATPSTAADANRPSEGDAEMQVEYRPIDGDPSLIERVVRIVGSNEGNGDSEPMAAEELSSVRRAFSVPAAFWLVGLKSSVGDRQREILADLYGESVLDEVRPIFEAHGAEAFEERCRECAASLSGVDQSTRVDILRELCRVAMFDEKHPGPFEEAFLEIVELLGLSADDLSMILSDYVDPEYAHYRFEPDELVDVHLDGHWLEGKVERVDASGELRVRFASTQKVLRLHPTADFIRPRPRRQVG